MSSRPPRKVKTARIGPDEHDVSGVGTLVENAVSGYHEREMTAHIMAMCSDLVAGPTRC